MALRVPAPGSEGCYRVSDVKVSFQCEGCGASLSFPSSEAGTVQDCPECGGWIDVPEVTRAGELKSGPPWGSLQEELNARYFEECLRQQAENGRQIEVNREHQRVSDENIEREKAVLTRQEALLDQAARIAQRYEQMADRLDALLSKWEKTS
jgi:hypothetical protein